MFVSVTGGMSFEVGGLCALEAGAEVWGISPVRTIGGCNRVEIARLVSFWAKQIFYAYLVPFWPYSLTPCECKAVSNVPPIECIELAVESRRGWCLLLEPDLPPISI